MTGTPGGHAPHCREVGACLRPPPAHSLHTERKTTFEGGLIAAEKDRECRSDGEASCLDRITYRNLMR
jgi:hypothetical protein